MMAARQGNLQAFVAGLFILLLPSIATAQTLQSPLPSALIEQLNRTQAQTPYDPAQSSPSPLDQVRRQQTQQQFPQAQSLQPGGNVAPEPPSKLERDYARRAGTALKQYGYDVFRTMIPSSGQLQTGAVADDYRLSIGDELVITLQGQVSRSVRTRVDSEGRVVIPEVPPVPAAGRSFGEVRQDLERAVAMTFLNTSVFMSVGAVRQISVAVLGEANAPGIYRMGGFATVLDALAMAGGVKKSGSLRRIALTRGSATTTIDLYSIMAGVGTPPALSLADGDRLMIPPVGATVAVSGEVQRPGIFELARSGAIDGQQLLALAGGPLRPSGSRFVKLSLDQGGRDMTTEVRGGAPLSIRAGDILMVLLGGDLPVGSVRLDGNVRVPGVRSLAVAPDVRRLIASSDTFLDDPYLLFGVVQTTDAKTRAHRLVPINLEAVMSGAAAAPLKDGDTVIVLSLGDVNYLASADVQAVLAGQPPPLLREHIVTKNPRSSAAQRGVEGGESDDVAFAREMASSAAQRADQQQAAGTAGVPGGIYGQPLPAPAPSVAPQNAPAGSQQPAGFDANQFAQQSLQICRGLQQLAAIVQTARPGRFSNAVYATTVTAAATAVPAPQNIRNVFPCPAIFDKYPDILPLLVESAAAVEGEVRIPGPYPITGDTALSSIISEAGGLAREADLRRIEITHYAADGDQASSRTERELLQLTQADFLKVALHPGDVVRFNPIYTDRDDGLVTLTGEFRRPGFYAILRGERLSQLIERAGGLTEQAYPYGAVFTRLSVKDEEARQFSLAARRFELEVPTVLGRAQSTEQAQALAAATQTIAAEVRSAIPVGRVVVEADPTVLQVKPQLDPIMQPGDSVFLPKRPSSVAVTGEVLNPTSLQFRAGASPADYIRQAGGLTQSAESDATFIIFPNGEARPVQVSFWNFTPIQVPPGSTIVVPKDLTPFDLTNFLRDSTQILSQLAISAASLAVIHSGSTR
jgi:protein involved in polysaccharide export with SLBB domain